MSRAIFLDRDGTIIKEKEYLRDVAQVDVFPEALTGLKRLAGAGFKLFIVSNQIDKVGHLERKVVRRRKIASGQKLPNVKTHIHLHLE